MSYNVLNISKSQGGLFRYINEINKFPIITEKQEIQYAKLKEQGNLEAVKMLISSHLRLVVKIAFKYKDYKLPIIDLIQEGNIGLMRAVKGFELNKGCRFATYAMWWIKAQIQEYILKSWSLVKIGTTTAQKKLFFNLRKIKNRILKYNRKELTTDEIRMIANEYEVDEKEVANMDIRLSGDKSLNAKVVGDESEVEVVDLIPAKQVSQEQIVDEIREKEKKKKIFEKAFAILDNREKDIILNRKMRDKPLKLKDLSSKYGISDERVRQVEKKAVEKMRIFIKKILIDN